MHLNLNLNEEHHLLHLSHELERLSLPLPVDCLPVQLRDGHVRSPLPRAQEWLANLGGGGSDNVFPGHRSEVGMGIEGRRDIRELEGERNNGGRHSK